MNTYLAPMYTMSSKIICLLSGCIALMVLNSCSRTYKRCYEHAFAADGVYCASNAVYTANGKDYVQGQRAQLRHVRYRSWENFYEWYWNRGWSLKPIPGTEGETVYGELYTGEDGQLRAHNSLEWQPLQGVKVTPRMGKVTKDNCTAEDRTTRRLTWRGVYALPASAACFAVEAPFNIVSSVVFLVGDMLQAW